MRAHHAALEVATTRHQEIIDITGQVRAAIAKSGINEGLCTVQSLHTTAGIFVNVTEDLDGDILGTLDRLCPADRDYAHNKVDPNAQAHLKKLLLGRSATIVVRAGKPVLGTWEKVQFAEFDGPRRRTVDVSVHGE